ncbi:hypothetical protein J2T17_004420 [Paenibacillus mucilaginosus]|uniref:hypothetical protein n=1 Tax=Paenibacillus mucilaginosus TaxID=61624 RepID=UPI003D22E50A
MIVAEFLYNAPRGRGKVFRIKGPKGSIQIQISYTNRKYTSRGTVGKRLEYQVDKMHLGDDWIEDDFPDMRIALEQIGVSYEEKSRLDWLQAVYQGKYTPLRANITEPLSWDDELDGQTTTTYHRDQLSLRESLLADRTEAPCIICGDIFPEDLLWAAHLKKRSVCTEEEKKDHANVAKLMCKMGCDDLYEKGYLGVVEGKIRPFRRSSLPVVAERLNSLSGRTCSAWNDKTSVYFKWHFEYFNAENVQD